MKKILWAIDAFQSDASIDRHAVQLVRNLATKTGAKVEPVYILSPEQLNLSVEFTPDLLSHYQPSAERALKQVVSKTDIPNLLPPKVITQRFSSLTQAVHALNAHALLSGADLIAVGTHSKKGLARFFLGSFTEALLLHSKVPVLTINPKTKAPPARDAHILFATDTSQPSQEAFASLLKLAKDVAARLTLYHYVRNPIEPIVQSGAFLLGGGWIPVSTYVRDESAVIERTLEKMADKARKLGIKTEVLIDSGFEGITEGILENAASRKATMIALAAQSGPVAATIIGSVARQVVRAAELPVWVIHTGTKKEMKKPSKAASRRRAS